MTKENDQFLNPSVQAATPPVNPSCFDKLPAEVLVKVLTYTTTETLVNFSKANIDRARAWSQDKKTLEHHLAKLMQTWKDRLEAIASSARFKLQNDEDRKNAEKFLNELLSIIPLYEKNKSTTEAVEQIKSLLQQYCPHFYKKIAPTLLANPLAHAIRKEDIHQVEILLLMGANPFATIDGYSHQSPFQYAVALSNHAIIKAIIESQQKDSSEFSEGLRLAITKKNIKLMNLLIPHAENVINVNKNPKYSLLNHAVTQKDSCQEMAAILLSAGATINKFTLNTAIANKDNPNILETIKLLLEWGADVNLAQHKKETPLSVAVNNLFATTTASYGTQCLQVQDKFMEIVKLLIRNGAHYDLSCTQSMSKEKLREFLQEEKHLNALQTFAIGEKAKHGKINERRNGSDVQVKTLVDYINTVGLKVQQVIEDSQINQIFNTTQSVHEKLVSVLKNYANPGLLSVGNFSFSVSRFCFYHHSHTTEIRALLQTLAAMKKTATAEECHTQLNNTLAKCQQKPGYNPDGTLELLGGLLLTKLKCEMNKEALLVRKQSVRFQLSPSNTY